MKKILIIISCSLILACGSLTGGSDSASTFVEVQGNAATSSSYTGYIAFAESTNRTVMLFNTNFSFDKYLFIGPSGVTAEIPFSLGMYGPDNVMILIDGNDRVIYNSLSSPTPLGSMLVSDVTNLVTATRGGITQISNGDILITEGGTNFIERYTVAGVRNASGWPVASLTGVGGIDKITTGVASGGFVHCGITADQARTSTATGVTLATATTVATHDFVDCVAHTDGRIAVALNGATDRVRIYTDYLMTTFCDFTNATYLQNPLALDFKPNGNVVVWDGTTRLLIEVSPTCGLVNTYNNSYLTPVTVTDLIVIQ